MMENEVRPVADRLEGVPLPSESLHLFGHGDEAGRIASMYREGRLHHGWLLVGPKGIGKSTLAFHLARHILSHPNAASAPARPDAANWPAQVVGQVAQASHPNLLHLTRPWDDKTKKFKTQLSVDEVRRTQEFYGLTAGSDGLRIAIVDSADEMNPNSANALLKILEEPPEKSLFFIIVHSAGNVLPTIRSRCQTINLKPLAQPSVEALLSQFDLGIDEAEQTTAAQLAEGSARRAVMLATAGVLEAYSAFSGLMDARATGSPKDWLAVHTLADNVAGRGREEVHALFCDMVLAWVAKRTRDAAHEPPLALAPWVAAWETANRTTAFAQTYNLDRRQVVLSLFGQLFACNRGELPTPVYGH